MNNDIAEFVVEMKRLGISRLKLGWPQAGVYQVKEIELSDTIPAPPAFDELTEPEPDPIPEGICQVPGCGEKANCRFAAGLCRTHGLKAAGVT